MKKKILLCGFVPALVFLVAAGFHTGSWRRRSRWRHHGHHRGHLRCGKGLRIGMEEAFKYINDQGGVNGKKVKYTWFDYGYRIPEAITKYNLLKRLGSWPSWAGDGGHGIALAHGQQGSTALCLRFLLGAPDRSAKTPYNLFFSSDYSTNARAALTAWFDKKWPKKDGYGKRKPKLACSYMFASPYSSAPIKAIKDHAALLGFEVGDDQDVSLFALDTKSQVMAMKKFQPDVIWHGNTTIRSRPPWGCHGLGAQGGPHHQHWGFDENLPRLAKEAAEGAMGATPCAFFGQNVKNMSTVVDSAKKYSPGVPQDKRLIRTIQAWGDALLIWEAMKRADKAGDLTGRGS